ncbi:Na+/H+ antiporter subunit E [Pelistega sp. NLN82]|uniref:Na+/H+ antiporter subunit E n=1 Tax=Pelistega ratti TaxID=2652177 RepID=A0A6L9Y4K0_9BURK|nr:Na+/H+ antiporter subunit E [Pelistega ratti]NEN75125.1 Na+/H+ antiporter subunit E [Pelistega ratti]
MISLFFWLPMTIFLTLIWLLLANAITLGQFLLGGFFSFIFVSLSLRIRPDLAYPRRISVMIKLAFRVIIDIIKSNWNVGLLILQWRRKDFTSGYVYIPLEIRDPHALAFLACIITYTPGTVWSGLTEKDFILRLHVLDLRDESEWFDTIKNRYEKLLLEIFE